MSYLIASCMVSTSGKSLATSTARDSWSDLTKAYISKQICLQLRRRLPAGKGEQFHNRGNLLVSKACHTFFSLFCLSRCSQKSGEYNCKTALQASDAVQYQENLVWKARADACCSRTPRSEVESSKGGSSGREVGSGLGRVGGYLLPLHTMHLASPSSWFTDTM